MQKRISTKKCCPYGHGGMGWGCCTYGEETYAYREKRRLKDPDVNERIILKFIYNKWDVRFWTGFI
jgi:hypothetical protein